MSAIIAGLIPKIEGFQPIPNAVMIPFMEAQSAALAYGFGLNYEYGKRKIRSMSNEEYNSLTSEDITNMSNAHTHIILSKFQLQVPAVMPMQQEIFKQYVIIEKAKVQQNFELAKWMVAFIKEFVDDETAHLLGGHIHPLDSVINPQEFQDLNDEDKDFAPVPPIQGPKEKVPVPQIPPIPNQPKLPPQQQAEKNLIGNLLKVQKIIVEKIKSLHNQVGQNASNQKNFPGKVPQFLKNAMAKLQADIVKQNAMLKAASLNLNKKQQDYKNKYGVWLN